MNAYRALLPLSLAALLAGAPPGARAQGTPAAAPQAAPKAQGECKGESELRAREEQQGAEAQKAYDRAMSAYDKVMDQRDSTTVAAYHQAIADYRTALRQHQEAVNRIMRLEMDCMRIQIDSMRIDYQSSMPKGWLGITFSGTIDESTEKGKRIMRFKEYPTIESIEPGSPAEKAGVEGGDLLLSIAGSDLLKGCPTFDQLLIPGRKLDLKLKRSNAMLNRVLVVEKRPVEWNPMRGGYPRAPRAVPEAPEAPEPPYPDEGGMRAPLPPRVIVTPRGPGDVSVSVSWDELPVAGAHVQRFAALKQYFGVDSGVLVLSVIASTPAAEGGLRDGDVIVRAGGKAINGPLDFSNAVKDARDRGTLNVEIVRQRKRQTLQLKW